MPFETPASPPGSLLVIRLGAVGDVIRTLPAVSCLRQSFPKARIGWAVEDPSREILVGHPDVDQVHVLPRRLLRKGALPARLLRAPAIFRTYGSEIRGLSFEWVVDLHGTFKSGLIARMSGAPRRFGFGPGHAREHASLFYTDHFPLPRRRMSRVSRALAAVEALGANIASPRRRLPERPEAARWAASFLAGNAPERPRVLISPGTSEAQAFKRYPAALFARLADMLMDRTGGSVILAWGPGEESIVGDVRSSMRQEAVPTPPTTLLELAEIARRCDLFIGSDTGPTHLAAAAGLPVIALFGPTDITTNAPFGDRPSLCLEGDTICRPCRNRGCLSRACLWRIDPGHVAEEASRLLEEAGPMRGPTDGPDRHPRDGTQ